ncbi:hypothetical protein Q9966_007505 [Columba livia]|nr:hypothetical protein Q9966_007505 [Columba livia]
MAFSCENTILLENDFSSTLQTALAFTTHKARCWMCSKHPNPDKNMRSNQEKVQSGEEKKFPD